MEVSNPPAPETADADRIRFGAGYRLPTVTSETTDAGRVLFGAGYRLPADRAIG